MWLIFWCVWHGFAWFGMIYDSLVSVWSISSKSQFCSWPLIAPPPCVVSVCGWNGPETPSNITATWLLNFTLHAWYNLCNKCVHQFVWGNCEKILRQCDWNWLELSAPNHMMGLLVVYSPVRLWLCLKQLYPSWRLEQNGLQFSFRAWVDMAVQRPRQCLQRILSCC